VYNMESSGFSPYTGDFWNELFRGLASGFAPGLLLGALPFLAIGLLGFLGLMRRNWVLPWSLLSPPLLCAFYLLFKGYTFAPRFFILGLPLAFLCGVEGISIAAGWLLDRLKKSRRFAFQISLAFTFVVFILSVISLRRYYSMPKQNFRAAIAYVEKSKSPGDLVMPVYLADWGYKYYGEKMELHEGRGYFSIRSAEKLSDLLSRKASKRAIFLTTFTRALKLDYPDIYDQLQKGWIIDRTFPGTLGGGAINVWRERDSPPLSG